MKFAIFIIVLFSVLNPNIFSDNSKNHLKKFDYRKSKAKKVPINYYYFLKNRYYNIIKEGTPLLHNYLLIFYQYWKIQINF